MLTLEPSVAAFAALKQNLRLANGRILPFLSAKIDQALARGAGAFTWELLRAGWTGGSGDFPIPLSISAFVDRYAEFTDEQTAVAMGEILSGKRLVIDFEVHAPTRQHDLETITYAVHVRLTEADGTPCEGRFTVPSFVEAAGHEPYRLASAYTHKWDGPGAETRRNNGRDLVSALVRAGTWEGTFFIYDRAHRDAPAEAITAAKAGLARSILTALSLRPRCFVEKPAGFSSRVLQVRMTLPRAVSIAWGGSPFVFTIPELEKRHFRIEGKYGLLLESGWRCSFVEGEWVGLCQSNGVAEHLNPTPMPAVKAALLNAVHTTLQANGVTVQA
ncbi:hypothetical protein [Cupriavidus pampae]|uniref:Uncharacterized protein n=1 Tax=Cupriavidus pampae TaxID=659251 RepID=A0ABM8XZU9_9BURK|nr:hypothetical protein [Cupriavidus pampae]CAG9185985.1 hypothetical protein LMG32289_06194 [Cupriavidus pampae]